MSVLKGAVRGTARVRDRVISQTPARDASVSELARDTAVSDLPVVSGAMNWDNTAPMAHMAAAISMHGPTPQ
jgi:hypothetical protein